MEADIKVENLGSLQRDLSVLASKLTKQELAPILKPGAKEFQREVKRRAPKRSGALKSAIKVKVGKGKATAPYANLLTVFGKVGKRFKGNNARWGDSAGYGYFVHNGTIVGADGKRIRLKSYKAKGRQRIKPNPFVYEAFEANVQRVATAILNKIEANL
jgi:hypothetical protein